MSQRTHPTPSPTGLDWDRLTYRTRLDLAARLNGRLLALRDRLADVEADTRTAYRVLATARARLDATYENMRQLQKENTRLERRNARLKKEIAKHHRELRVPTSPALAEATTERMRKP
jgi:chromosome segregation ATPase